MSKRARILNNNPLSQTDSVLDSFDQHTKSENQEVDSIESTQSHLTDLTNTVKPAPVEASLPAKFSRRKVNKPTSQQPKKSTSRQVSNLKSQQADKPTLKKATFQMSESVLQQLDIFHLQLQLELGKTNTPYKEVMVEEAILMLLERASQNRTKVITSLQSRHHQRQEPNLVRNSD